MDITFPLLACVPGLDLLDVTYRLGDGTDTETHVFCDTTSCLLPPGHDGDHDPNGTRTSTDGQ